MLNKNSVTWVMRQVIPLILGFQAMIYVGCTKSLEGEYSDPDKVEIIDDQWNETDARKTSQAMIKGMLDKPWLAEFNKANKNQRPIVVVDEIQNSTDEHINTQQLGDFIQDELINSGKVRFLDKAGRDKILQELKYQESGVVAKDKSIKRGKQIGAQYYLKGSLASIVQQEGKQKTVTYQTNLILTNLETAEIEWSEKYLIKKRFKRARAKW